MREKKDISSQVDPAISQELIKIDHMSDADIDEKLAQMLVCVSPDGVCRHSLCTSIV